MEKFTEGFEGIVDVDCFVSPTATIEWKRYFFQRVVAFFPKDVYE